MKKDTVNKTVEFVEENRKERIRKQIVRVLACIVVVCTVYALVLPALSVGNNNDSVDCATSVHQHSEACFNELNELICGKADFVVHRHDEKCYDEKGNLRCTLEERIAHNHSDACYEESMVLICQNTDENHTHSDEECYKLEKKLICQEKAILHTHIDTCYDEAGKLICGMLEVKEHIHSDECFKEDQATSETVDNSEISTVSSDAVTPRTEKQAWGYNDDGSIWWGIQKLDSVDTIEENKGYIITGYQENTVLKNEEAVVSLDGQLNGANVTYDFHGIKAEDTTDSMEFQQYEYWYFEKAEGDKQYYIYCMNADNQKKYVKMTKSDFVKWNPTAEISLIDDKAQASVLTVDRGSSVGSAYPTHYIIYQEFDNVKYYINSYYGDQKKVTTHYWGYPEVGNGMYLKVTCHDVLTDVNTSNKITTTDSPNSVINLFDYWSTPNQSDSDTADAILDGGINKNHAFKFVKGTQMAADIALNRWSGGGKNPYQGIVSNKLSENGYPVLSGKYPLEGYNSTESLEYVFNPNYAHEGKESFKNVTGLLRVDEHGYYTYDADKNMAEYKRETNQFNVYDKPGVGGSFFPFNKAPQTMMSYVDDEVINHYFGMTLTTRFVQRHGGFTDDKHTTPTTFSFSGDDDVWVFLDGILVGDVGGIHDACDLTINFSTGEVSVSIPNGVEKPLNTTIYECYEAANATDKTVWNEAKTTFADNTVHTLKFFYLERGAHESNLMLQYNLADIPKTAIYKTDQYSRPVADVDFTIYAANKDFEMLSDKDGSVVNIPEGSPTHYDPDNNDILDASENVLAKALYKGKTDAKGEMVFVDENGFPLSINELEEKFGKYFILRETKMPSGYRWVSEDTHLSIWQSAVQKFLHCENMKESGTRAAVNLQVTATDVISIREPYNGSHQVEYVDENGNVHGTLFAVVFKYVGEINANGKATEITDVNKWCPVWGSDKDGYTIVPINTTSSDSNAARIRKGLNAALKAAKESKAHYGEDDFVFRQSKVGTMSLTMDNLPGDIMSYYLMLNDKADARYTVAYYWSDQDSIDTATPDNTRRIYTFKDAAPEEVGYSAFDRVFGANIYVPNLMNQVLVQKQSKAGYLVDGATFGIYPVHQLDDGTLEATATDGTTVVFPKEKLPDEVSGEIEVDGKKIAPYETDITKTYNEGGNTDIAHEGTARFVNLPAGQYIVKEIKAPTGFDVNPADVMTLVTNDMIYANAGTANDGVTVGRGPGYLVDPLALYGAVGQIDDTLSWVYARMLISRESTKFSDATNKDPSIWGYLTKNFTGNKGTKEQAVISYLEYSKEEVAKFNGLGAFNFKINTDRSVENGAQNPSEYRRLFTTVGWNHYAILQDYDYGVERARALGANYQDWRRDKNGNDEYNLMHLFSRSTYIMVTDQRKSNRLILRTIDANTGNGVANAQFRFYKIGENNAKQYYTGYDATNNTATWSTSQADAQITTSGADGVAPQVFDGLDEGTYYFEEVTKPEPYLPVVKPVKLKYVKNAMTLDSQGQPGPYHITDGYLDEATDLFTFKATIPYDIYYHLPETGGIGTSIYFGTGLILICIAGIYLVLRKKKLS